VNKLIVSSLLPLLLTLCLAAQQGTILHVRGQITDATTHRDVAGVSISSVLARHDATTDANGFFVLELRDGVKPGDDVRIHIQKSGYRADDVTEAASETVTYPIRIRRLGKPSGSRSSPGHAKLADPDATGYLRSIPFSIRFDPHSPDDAAVSYNTTNLGKQILPGATVWAYIRVRPQMSAEQEDALFSTASFGGGPAALATTERNYWEHGDSRHGKISGSPDWQDPEDFTRQVRQMQKGETSIYFLVRGPDFSVPPFQCHGHNGPTEWPNFIPKTFQRPW